jgi:hypothetical protein
MNIATQGWWCRSLQWFCDGDGVSRSGQVAPEIGDTWALTLAWSLVIGVGCIVYDRWRKTTAAPPSPKA